MTESMGATRARGEASGQLDRQARGLSEGQERPGRMELGSAALPEGAPLTLRM